MSEFTDATIVKAGAITESVSHHLDVWREALAADRARPRLDIIGQAELAFLPAALEVSETPANPAARAAAFTLIGFFAVALLWGAVAKLDEVATAPGKVVHVDGTQAVQPLETSRLKAVLVKEGDEVAKGDVLVELEVVGASADVQRLTAEHDASRAAAARLAALLAPDPPAAVRFDEDLPAALVATERAVLESQWREHQAKLATLTAELGKREAEKRTMIRDIEHLAGIKATVLDRLERRRNLAGQGYGSEMERLKAEQELQENERSIASQRNKLGETDAAIKSLEAQGRQTREEFRRDVAARLAESRAKAATSAQEQAKARERHQVQSLRAPVAGKVQEIELRSTIVQPAQKLMVVVPKTAKVVVEARLANKDIGVVEAGQDAEVKVDAFRFTRYGTLKGRVSTVSTEAVQDEQKKDYYFPIRVTLDEATVTVENGKQIPLTPGMTVTAEVKAGTRTPLSYLLEPMHKLASESLRETR